MESSEIVEGMASSSEEEVLARNFPIFDKPGKISKIDIKAKETGAVKKPRKPRSPSASLKNKGGTKAKVPKGDIEEQLVALFHEYLKEKHDNSDISNKNKQYGFIPVYF
jgi:hypothetical protein